MSFNDYGDKEKTVDLSGIVAYFKELKKQKRAKAVNLSILLV